MFNGLWQQPFGISEVVTWAGCVAPPSPRSGLSPSSGTAGLSAYGRRDKTAICVAWLHSNRIPKTPLPWNLSDKTFAVLLQQTWQFLSVIHCYKVTGCQIQWLKQAVCVTSQRWESPRHTLSLKMHERDIVSLPPHRLHCVLHKDHVCFTLWRYKHMFNKLHDLIKRNAPESDYWLETIYAKYIYVWL